ncbi:MAG: type II toxin-antitoxin system Phd/YefM family antitoxin [Symploca sp. SIO1C2]|nr:type II toxin-antitoxin system Phd/YefM family antitoxin [Symploca sp. SIO1C2]
MQHYTLTDARNRQSEVFNKATTEPVLLTNQSLPSHVLMSVDTYQNLIERLQKLEEEVLGKAVEAALNQSQMVGVETFTSTLEGLANGEA